MAIDATTRSNWETLRKNVQAKRREIDQRIGARDQLIKNKDIEEKSLLVSKKQQGLAQQAQVFLLAEIAQRRTQAIQRIEHMGTAALRMVYGPGYELKFQTFDEKKNDPTASNYKMEILIGSPQNGQMGWSTVLESRGGSVADVVSFALRIAALDWMSYEGPLLMDEAYKHIDDKQLEAIAKFLKQIAQDTGRQFIFPTHQENVFAKVAARIINIENEDGTATATVVKGGLAESEYDDEDFEG